MAHKQAIVCDRCYKTEVYEAKDGAPSSWLHLTVLGLGGNPLDDAGDFCSLAHAVLWLQEGKM